MRRLFTFSSLASLSRIAAVTCFFYTHAALAQGPKGSNNELVINAVIASVDGKPITLEDLAQRLQPPRQLSIKEASSDPEASAALDSLVMEHLVMGEAESRRISVGDEELDHYINEVARRNNLTREGFEKALVQQGKSLAEYRRFIRVDILKSKLASSIAQSGVGVTKEEVKQYLSEHPELSRKGSKMKLAQILISTERHGEQEAQNRLVTAQKKLQQGQLFGAVARELSDSPDAADGGLIGVVAEKDLQGEIFDAVFSLQPGETSRPVSSTSKIQLFHLIERFDEQAGPEAIEKLEQEIRQNLIQRKLETKMSSFFSADLLKTHSVDRKI